MKKLEYVVVNDTHMSETAELADIVIPGSVYLERYDFTGLLGYLAGPGTQEAGGQVRDQRPDRSRVLDGGHEEDGA